MQDAFNLAWKVAFAVKGYAGQGLLESYTDERAPVGKQIVARANQSRKDYAGLREWFDHDSDDPVTAGLTTLKAPTAEGEALRSRLYEALELKNTEFNAHGIELNQRYTSTAVLPDDTVGEEEWPHHRELYLQATTRPGAKLPHAWLVGTDGRRVSTLDVTGKGQMTLLTGIAGVAWKDAAAKLELPFLKTVVIGEPGALDPYGYWQQVRDIPEAGALLVRPDGYIAWRHNAEVWDIDEATTLLEAALDTLLDRPVHRPARTEHGRQQYSTRSVDITVPSHAPTTPPEPARVHAPATHQGAPHDFPVIPAAPRPYTSVWNDLKQVEFAQGFLQAGPYRTRFLHAGDTIQTSPAVPARHHRSRRGLRPEPRRTCRALLRVGHRLHWPRLLHQARPSPGDPALRRPGHLRPGHPRRARRPTFPVSPSAAG